MVSTKTMLFQLVRHQRQGWRSSLYAQVGQPTGETTVKHQLRKTANFSTNYDKNLKFILTQIVN